MFLLKTPEGFQPIVLTTFRCLFFFLLKSLEKLLYGTYKLHFLHTGAEDGLPGVPEVAPRNSTPITPNWSPIRFPIFCIGLRTGKLVFLSSLDRAE